MLVKFDVTILFVVLVYFITYILFFSLFSYSIFRTNKESESYFYFVYCLFTGVENGQLA